MYKYEIVITQASINGQKYFVLNSSYSTPLKMMPRYLIVIAYNK